MNIVLVSHCDFHGQSAYHVHSIAKELAASGCSCIICVPSGADQAVHQITPAVPIVDYETALEAGLIFPDGNRPTLIHCWTPREHVRRFATSLCEKYECPYLVHLEDNEWEILKRECRGLGYDNEGELDPSILNDDRSRYLINPQLHRQFMKNAAGCTVLIDRLLEHVPEGVPGLVFWPGYDDIFSFSERAGCNLRGTYGIADSDFVIYYSGAFHACNEDEIRQMLLAVDHLKHQGVPLKLLKTGHNLLPPILPSQVLDTFMIDLGFIPRYRLPELLDITDVIIQPGSGDAFNDFRFPSKLPEALISGRPLILPRSNLGRFLADGVDALITETGLYDEVASKIKLLYDDPVLRRSIGAAGQAFAARHLQWRKSSKKIMDFYIELCPASSGIPSVSKDSSAEYRFSLIERNKETDRLGYAIMERDAQIMSLTQMTEGLNRRLDSFHSAVANMTGQIAELNQSLSDRDSHIRELSHTLSDYQDRINCLATDSIERNNQIKNLTAALSDNQSQIHHFCNIVAERDRQLKAIYSSRSWRLTEPLRRLRSIFAISRDNMARGIISGTARGLWQLTPLSHRSKQKLKSALFGRMPLLFRNTLAYRKWQCNGMPGSDLPVPAVTETDCYPQCADRHSPSSREVMKSRIEGEFGINVVGSITSESGVGEAVRADIRSIDSAGIPRVLYNVISNSSEADNSYRDFSDNCPFKVNLIHLNADSLPVLWNLRGTGFLRNKYNIGYWFWELSEFPHIWHDHFRRFDEIWVATDFCLDAISRVSPVPVVKMQLPIIADISTKFDRAHYRLTNDSFLFFFMFDFLSYFERKNPLAVIEAFRSAFSLQDNAELLIKCSNSDWNKESRKKLEEAAQGLRIHFMDDRLPRGELNNLISLTDCYISLHRSEGFGLPLAEAMYLGKPAIATAYSGNLEFMNVNNSFLTKYKLVEIEEDFGPYRKGRVWADADVEHASELMRLVFENRDLAIRTGQRAASDIRAHLNPEVCGKRILDRIRTIRNDL